MSAPTTPPPAELGRYRIVRRLGAGGMAEVFLAKSTGAEGIEKILVVKRVLPSFAKSHKFIAMFVDEAKVAMRLNHPNIVQVYAFEQVDEEFLLAMEFVDGLDLGRLVSAARRRGSRVPYDLCAYIVAEVSKGLDYAHKRRDESGREMEIVHRDVSPQNVLISYDGVVKIADFGIARARLVSEETGVIKGKFSYMSPEQARGQRVDRRSDVYSLGVLLAELLMNRSMYAGHQGMEVLEMVREGRRTLPRQVDPDVPVALDEVVRRATDRDPDRRFQTARSLAGELSRWLHEQKELLGAEAVERFVGEVAPREVTSPDGARGARLVPSTATAATHASVPGLGRRRPQDRRNVVVVHVRFRHGEDAGEVTGVERRGLGVGDPAVRMLEDIAYKYYASLEWPDGRGERSFRLLIGSWRTTVDDPLHATRVSLDILDALEGLSPDLPCPLRASIGLSRGVVVIDRDGGGRRHPADPDGVYDVARALAEHGAAGEVLATGEVYRLARRLFSFDEEEERAVTVVGPGAGARRFRVYRLRGARTREERASEARALVREAGLFGRAAEIESISSIYAEVLSSGTSAYICVTGDLGVGKTAFLAAALERLEPAPRVLRVECTFGSSDLSYEAVAELVREACGIAEDDPAERARERLAETVREVLPPPIQDHALEALGPLVAPERAAPEDPGDRSAGLARAVRHLLGGLARTGPLVVWVDALQFADEASLKLVSRLMGQSYDATLVVILSSRPDERIEEHLGKVPRIELEELGQEDRERLIRHSFGGAEVPDDIVRSVVRCAGGNPFFLKELVEALLDRQEVRIDRGGPEPRVVRREGAAFALPTTLEGVIAARLAELPEPERHALCWLALTRLAMGARELGTLTGEDLEEELRSLERRGLLQRRGDGRGFSFRSEVVRRVAYESIDRPDRVRMHRMMSNYLVARGDRVSPAHLAYHRERAGDREGAARAYFEAGCAGRSRGPVAALPHFHHALRLLSPGSPLEFEAHAAREELFRQLGHRKEQRDEIEAMRECAERSGEPRQRAVAFNRLARHHLDAAEFGGVDAMLARALKASIEADDWASEVEARLLMGQLRRDQGDTWGAIEALDQALVRTRRDPDGLRRRGEVLAQKAILQWRVGQLDEALESGVEAVVIFRRLGPKWQEADALSQVGLALAGQGAFEDAITVMRSSILLDRQTDHRLRLGRRMSNVGQLYAELGDVEGALGFLRRALEIFEGVEDRASRVDTLCALAELLAVQVGDLEGAEVRLRDARRLAESIQDPYDLAHVCLVEAALRALQGDHAAAARAAREAWTHARSADVRSFELQAMAARAEALVRCGVTEEGAALADELWQRVRDPTHLERADHIYLALARTFELAGLPERAREAMERARAAVEGRLSRIRDARLREAYLETEVARSIREGAPPP